VCNWKAVASVMMASCGLDLLTPNHNTLSLSLGELFECIIQSGFRVKDLNNYSTFVVLSLICVLNRFFSTFR
jgi:hypothetical protein